MEKSKDSSANTSCSLDNDVRVNSDKSSCLTLDAEVLDMIEVAEKAIIVLAMHLNDSYEGQLDRERAKMVSIALVNVLSFVNSAETVQKVAFVNGLQSKVLIIEGLGTYFMQHWTGIIIQNNE